MTDLIEGLEGLKNDNSLKLNSWSKVCFARSGRKLRRMQAAFDKWEARQPKGKGRGRK